MLILPSRTKMFLCMNPVDMRKSFDGLFGIVREEFRQDPLSGHLFLFVNKRRDRTKAIFWDDDGFVIWYERLEKGTFEMPRVSDQSTHITLDVTQPSMLLGGVSLAAAKQRRKRLTITRTMQRPMRSLKRNVSCRSSPSGE